MRTTVDIPDPTYRRLKAEAAAQGSSVKALVLRGVEKELRSSQPKRQRIALPLVASKQPGKLRITSKRIYETIPFP